MHNLVKRGSQIRSKADFVLRSEVRDTLIVSPVEVSLTLTGIWIAQLPSSPSFSGFSSASWELALESFWTSGTRTVLTWLDLVETLSVALDSSLRHLRWHLKLSSMASIGQQSCPSTAHRSRRFCLAWKILCKQPTCLHSGNEISSILGTGAGSRRQVAFISLQVETSNSILQIQSI